MKYFSCSKFDARGFIVTYIICSMLVHVNEIATAIFGSFLNPKLLNGKSASEKLTDEYFKSFINM